MATVLRKTLLIDSSDKSIGVIFPLQRGNSGYFNVSYKTIDQVHSNLKNLLMTKIGEREMEPEFGCDIHKAVFEPINSNVEEFIEEKINEAVQKWLPYVLIDNIEFDISPTNKDRNRIDMDITYSVDWNNEELKKLSLIIE